MLHRFLAAVVVLALVLACTGPPAVTPQMSGAIATEGPSEGPSAAPSGEASPEPSPAPSGEPSFEPSPAPSGEPSFEPFGTVTLSPDWDLDGAGLDVDSIAFWEAPDPADSLMFVTAKENQLVEVWAHPFVGRELAPLTHSSFPADSRVNGVVVDQQSDRLYVAVGSPKAAVVVFSLPALTYVDEYVGGWDGLGSEPNLAHMPSSAGGTLYVSSSRYVYLLNATSGEPIGSFRPQKGLETVVADAYHKALYIPDESDQTGVYSYTPNGVPDERAGSNVFGQAVFGADAEGILVYTCPSAGVTDDGRGLIVVSDQLPDLTEFEIFDRETKEHLGALRLSGVSNTDGIASTQKALPTYPMGIFVAVNDDRSVAGIGWDAILEATGLGCDEGASK